MPSEIVVCTYRAAADKRDEFREILKRHWPVLRELGVVLDEPRIMLEGLKDSTFVEVFAWRDAVAVETAHHHPRVMAVWERMGPLCEARDGRSPMEFPHFRRVE
ncbi:MAG: hypothetical protein FJW32_05265 [Acidobacteria bacterium]|nr:hypothetical protein [Acidobacteriota bacterium]